MTVIDEDFDPKLNLNPSSLEALMGIVGNDKTQLISFIHHGPLPGSAQITIPNAAGFAVDDKFKFYGFDGSALADTDASCAITSDAAYLVIMTDHCSEYVFTMYKPLSNNPGDNDGGSNSGISTPLLVGIIAAGIVLLAGAGTIAFIIVKKRKTNRKGGMK